MSARQAGPGAGRAMAVNIPVGRVSCNEWYQTPYGIEEQIRRTWQDTVRLQALAASSAT
jgi:hypothetical protein